MNIQYLGYQPQLNIRSYAFRVTGKSAEAREFILNIKIESLMDNKFKYQDIPDFCFTKLKHDLTCETEEQRLPLRITVSEAELQKYMEDHYPAKCKQLKPL